MAGLHFRRQHVIDGFIVDFYCHSARLVLEVDGAVHESPAAQQYDIERGRVLAARGLRLLRVSNDDVLNNLTNVLARIERAIISPAA